MISDKSQPTKVTGGLHKIGSGIERNRMSENKSNTFGEINIKKKKTSSISRIPRIKYKTKKHATMKGKEGKRDIIV